MTLVINPIFSLDFPLAYNSLGLSGTFRQYPEDFYVEEILGFSLAGEGEHLCLYIEKQSHNTHWVAAELARFTGIAEKDISVCGRKDRHAVTRQWFSLYDPHRKPISWDQFSMDGVRILENQRHTKKLRLGDHQANHFVIRLRQMMVEGKPVTSQQKVDAITEIQRRLSLGVPNYFGMQRFGIDGNNLLMADEWLRQKQAPPRKQRGMVLSAARSYLFNLVLAERVRQPCWKTVIEGDVIIDNDPTGPLWGRGRLSSAQQALSLEQQVLSPWHEWCERLEHQGLKQERRPLILAPNNIQCAWVEEDLQLSFDLRTGAFATSVLAEIATLDNPPNSNR